MFRWKTCYATFVLIYNLKALASDTVVVTELLNTIYVAVENTPQSKTLFDILCSDGIDIHDKVHSELQTILPSSFSME